MSENEPAYKRLNLQEITTVFVMRKAGEKFQTIADYLRRSLSAVNVAHNNYPHPNPRIWRLMDAQQRASWVFKHMGRVPRKKTTKKRCLEDKITREYVIDALIRLKWSPEIISAKLRTEKPEHYCCAKTIYTFIKTKRQDLRKYLPEAGKQRRARVVHRRGVLRQGVPRKKYIELRSPHVNNRTEWGHWEADTIVSKRGGSSYALLVLRERVSRFCFITKVPNLQAVHTEGSLRAFLMQLPAELRKSITFDNGPEFAVSQTIKLEEYFKKEGFQTYYCNPYQPQEKGAVENLNRRIRRHGVPKGTDIGTLPLMEVKELMCWLNNYPLKCLGYKSPAEYIDSLFPQYKMAA